jgi:predicted RNase H-like HicB family nuclease
MNLSTLIEQTLNGSLTEKRWMLTYKAMYKFLDGSVHAEVLDFPGAIAFGADLAEAQRMLGSALVDMAETHLLHGEALPKPNPACTDPEADLEELIHLLLTATPRVSLVPQGSAP